MGEDVSDLPPEIQDEIYRPGEDGELDEVEFRVERPKAEQPWGSWELMSDE